MGGVLSGFCPVCPSFVRFLSTLSGFLLTLPLFGKLGNLTCLHPMGPGMLGQEFPFFLSSPHIFECRNSLPLSFCRGAAFPPPRFVAMVES